MPDTIYVGSFVTTRGKYPVRGRIHRKQTRQAMSETALQRMANVLGPQPMRFVNSECWFQLMTDTGEHYFFPGDALTRVEPFRLSQAYNTEIYFSDIDLSTGLPSDLDRYEYPRRSRLWS